MNQLAPLLFTALFTSLILYFINNFADKRVKPQNKESSNLLALAIFKASLFVALGLVMKDLYTSASALNSVMMRSGINGDYLDMLSRLALLGAIALVALIVFMSLAIILYQVITQGSKIFLELANDNVAHAIIFASILLAVTVSMSGALIGVMEGFIPYPSIPSYR